MAVNYYLRWNLKKDKEKILNEGTSD